MKLEELKKNYPGVKVSGTLAKVIKSGETEKGNYVVFGFKDIETTGIMFGKKEELDKILEKIEIGDSVNLELGSSPKGNVLKSLGKKKDESGESEDSPQPHKIKFLSNEDMRAFVPDSVFTDSFKCGSCGEQNVMFKKELKSFILNELMKNVVIYHGE